MQLLDMSTYLPDDILTKVDRASMAFSLEARVPLLDHRIVEFAWTLPREFMTRHKQGKGILRDILYKYVPRHMIERPKMGFGVPIDTWLRGPLRDWAEELLNPVKIQNDGYFNVDLITRTWNEHSSGRHNHQHKLWTILMFQSWLEHNKNTS
jgi:asparagine synthase (glutamine-hydrolysing)